MSLNRLVYYNAIIGGWSGFVGWLLAEMIFLRGDGGRGGLAGLAMTGLLVGAAIGAGLNLVAGFLNPNLKQLIPRILVGGVIGGVGGVLGILLGNAIFLMGLPRAFGFMVLGLAVGAADGLYERSSNKLRNGLIGGALGGIVGGFLFEPLMQLSSGGWGLSSRATTFVVLGLAIGALIGLAQVVLKEAWLTVLDGYRPGRQLILSKPVTILGKAEHLQLPFIGPMNANLAEEHLTITRQADGGYVVADKGSQLGTILNQQPLRQPQRLNDKDVIKLGTNFVRFNQSKRSGSGSATPAAAKGALAQAPPPPPPPSKGKPPLPTAPAKQPIAPSQPKLADAPPQSKPVSMPPPPLKVETAGKAPPPPPVMKPPTPFVEPAKPAAPSAPTSSSQPAAKPKMGGMPPPPPPPRKPPETR